jgi:hypothetical protein
VPESTRTAVIDEIVAQVDNDRARFSKVVLAAQVLLFLALLVAPTCAFAEGYSRVSLPIPVEIDGRPVHCPLYFKLEVKSDNVTFDRFAASQTNGAPTMFVTAVQALRKGDAAKFASVWTAPNQMKISGRVSIALADNSAGSWMKVARSYLDFDRLTVVAEAHAGSDTMFVVDSPMKAGPTVRTAFYVGPDKNDQTRLSAVSSATPVLALVLDAFRAAQTDPLAFKPLANINLRYQYPIPLAGGTKPGGHPVFFEFDGSPTDFPVSDENVKAPTALLAFVRNENIARQTGENDLYASSFTPKSQEQVRRWLASPGAKLLPVSAGNVKFVLNAEPVFLVFSAPAAGSAWKPENLTYAYVVHEGGAYKLANFSYSTTFDDFLQDSSSFDERILKSAAARFP